MGQELDRFHKDPIAWALGAILVMLGGGFLLFLLTGIALAILEWASR